MRCSYQLSYSSEIITQGLLYTQFADLSTNTAQFISSSLPKIFGNIFAQIYLLFIHIIDILTLNISKTDIGISGGMNNMFQESVKKTQCRSDSGNNCVFILALLIVFTVVLYGIFKDDNSAPSLFGNRIYIMNGNGMEPRIAQGSAVFIDEGVMPAEPGNVILCNIDGRLAVLGY